MKRVSRVGVAAVVGAAAWMMAAAGAMGTTRAADPLPGTTVLVGVDTGEAFKGVVVSADAAVLVIQHATLGRLEIVRSQITRIEPVGGGASAAAAAAGAGEQAAAPAAEAPAAAEAAAPAESGDAITPEAVAPPESFFTGWKGNAELGINGASGNSENFAFRAGFGLKRDVEKMATSLALSYNYGTSDGEKNTDRGRLDLRNDWKLTPSRWRVFLQGAVEYDQFQDWDWRTTAFTGVGYELVKTDKILFMPRAGIGATKEFGGSDNRIRPEALGGFDFEYKIKDGHRLFVNVDSFWNLLDTPQYRVLTLAGYEILLDKDSGMALKLGLEDRYQSSPGSGKKRNDLLYFATLVWNF